MTRGERVVNGVTLHQVLAYRWGLYMLTAIDQHVYDSGIGQWTVARLAPTTLTLSYVDTFWSLSDALQGARAHSARLAEGEHS